MPYGFFNIFSRQAEFKIIFPPSAKYDFFYLEKLMF